MKTTSIARKLVALVMVFTLIFALSACGKEESESKKKKSSSETSVETSSVTGTGLLPEKLVAQKIAHISTESYLTVCNGGLVYSMDDKYGFITKEGDHDTGAKWAEYREENSYFVVSTKKFEDLTSAAKDLNCKGLIDASGKELIPTKYAYIDVVGNDFAVAYTASAVTTNKDKAICSKTDSTVFSGYSENGTNYEGSYEVYSLSSGKALTKPVTGKVPNYTEYGKYLTYYDADYNVVGFDINGKALQSGMKFMANGYVVIETTDAAAAYDPNMKKLFDYNPNEYSITNCYDNAFVAEKYVDGNRSCFLLDFSGKAISPEFTPDGFSVVGNLILNGKKIYNFKGENILKGTYNSVELDPLTQCCYQVKNDSTYTIFAEDGTVLHTGVEDKDYNIMFSYFTSAKKKGDDKYIYSYKDADYTVKGYVVSNFMAKVTDGDGRYDLIDLISGETMFEGYSSINVGKVADGKCYAYANRTEGGVDVYLIQTSFSAVTNSLAVPAELSIDEIKEIYQKKEDLFADLAAAFAKEGITVTTNKETGEIAIDSNVLFGGDSAEITADGKAVLDKFMKAYTSIIYNSKYDGFIQKTVIEGHTAPVVGTTYEDGLPLSKQRAENVKSYLTSAGKDDNSKNFASSLEAIGYSCSKPIYNLDGSANLEASRRVSFRFVINQQ